MLVRKVLARNLHAHTQSCTFTDEIDTYTLDKWIQGTGLLFKNDYSKVKSDGYACLQPLVLALCSRRDCQQPCKTRSEDNSCVTSCNNLCIHSSPPFCSSQRWSWMARLLSQTRRPPSASKKRFYCSILRLSFACSTDWCARLTPLLQYRCLVGLCSLCSTSPSSSRKCR